MTPDNRKAMNSIVGSVVIVAILGLIFWQTYLLASQPVQIAGLARLLIGILALNQIMLGAENITRAFKLTGPLGTSADFWGDAAAQVVADSAQATADIVKGVKK